MVWLKDLEMMLERDPIDWDQLVDRARTWRAALVVAMQSERARTVLGVPVPDQLIETLAGGSLWWRWWQHREHQLGDVRWGGYDRTGRTYQSATSATTSAGLVQLARSLPVDVVLPTVKERWRSSTRAATGEVPDLYRPVGGPQARADYLRMAATTGWG